MVSVKADEHWAFLEEIEAPMWVDLTLEANLDSHTITDEWFESSHRVHRCSARELKSAFSHSKASELESVGASSPKLPSSVSRSRGKDFKRKNWAGHVEKLRLNNQHSTGISSGSSPILDSCSTRRSKPKSSNINPTRFSSSKSSLTSESSVAMNIMPRRLKTSSIGENSKSRCTHSTQKQESGTGSTIAAESKFQVQKQVVEASSKVFGQSNNLISIMRKSLLNSRIAGQRSDSLKSLMGKKSSVGSSSSTGCDAKGLTMSNCHQKRDLEIRNVGGRMTFSAKNKMKSVNTKTPAILVEAKKSSLKPISRSFPAKTGKQEAVKPKVVSVKVLAPQRVDQRNSLHAATLGGNGKASYGGKNRVVVGVGKENLSGIISSNRKHISSNHNGKETRIGGMVVGCNQTKQNIMGKVNDKSDAKPKNGIGRIYLR